MTYEGVVYASTGLSPTAALSRVGILVGGEMIPPEVGLPWLAVSAKDATIAAMNLEGWRGDEPDPIDDYDTALSVWVAGGGGRAAQDQAARWLYGVLKGIGWPLGLGGDDGNELLERWP